MTYWALEINSPWIEPRFLDYWLTLSWSFKYRLVFSSSLIPRMWDKNSHNHEWPNRPVHEKYSVDQRLSLTPKYAQKSSGLASKINFCCHRFKTTTTLVGNLSGRPVTFSTRSWWSSKACTTRRLLFLIKWN